MKSLFTLILLSAFFLAGNAQNLISNPSFEDTSGDFCGIMGPGDFNSVMNGWSNPTQASPQVFFTTIDESCYNYQPTSTYDGPIGLKGSQLPHSGNVMAGLWMYTIDGLNQRHYIQAELSEPMQVGITYEVEFHVSLGDNMEFGIDQMGAYLSVDAPSATDDGVLDFDPQVAANGYVSNTDDWVLIYDMIVADQPYTHITIGNFKSDAETDFIPNSSSTGEPGTYGAFYFVDDVRVEANPISVEEAAANAEFVVYPTAVNDILNLRVPSAGEVLMYNAAGQLVYSDYMNNGTQLIDMSNFPRGLYVVSYQNLTRRISKL